MVDDEGVYNPLSVAEGCMIDVAADCGFVAEAFPPASE